VSKLTLDLRISICGEISQEIVLENTISELKKFFNKLFKKHKVSEILICCESTGHYFYPLSCVCSELNLALWIENAYHLKHSSGLQRGKNDKVDACRIVEYATRFQDKKRLFSLPDESIASLRGFLSEHEMYASDKAKYQGQLTDQKDFTSKSDYADKSKRLKGLRSVSHQLSKR